MDCPKCPGFSDPCGNSNCPQLIRERSWNNAMKRNPYSQTENAMWFAFGALAVVAIIWLMGAAPAKAADCWPWWQCNGTKETNHPNCKCWDSK